MNTNSNYKFQDDFLGVSDEKIHLLRNRFEYDSIPFHEIKEIRLINDRVIKNWIIILIIGVALLLGGGYGLKSIYDFFNSLEGGRIYLENVFIVIVMNLAGLFCIYTALKKEKVIQIKTLTKKENFSISKFEKEGTLDALIDHLSKKMNLKGKLLDKI